MARKNLGLLILSDHQWAGGLYYLINVIQSFQYLEDSDQPNIIAIYANEDAKQALVGLNYPYLKLIAYQQHSLLNLFSKFFQRHYYLEKLCRKYNLDALYPYTFTHRIITKTKVVAWFPDFQHKVYPAFFQENELKTRDSFINSLNHNELELVLSSHAVKQDYSKYYSHFNLKTHVCQFISHIDQEGLYDKKQITQKYNLADNYFLVVNQFHPQKNHITVLEAFYEYQKKHPQTQLVLTGKYELNEYTQNLLTYLQTHHLEQSVHLLGFIPRKDQLSLIKHTIALVQPSLFEGWNTGIEEAKTLHKAVLASDIPVHHEQLQEHAQFFNATEPNELCKLMESSQPQSNHLRLSERAKHFAIKLNQVLFKS